MNKTPKTKTNLLYTLSKNKNFIALVIVAIIFGVLALSFILFNVELKEDSLKITSLYGKTINISEIESVELTDILPSNMHRSNGASLGSKLLGNFKNESEGKMKLYIDKNQTPYLHLILKTDDPKHIYISLKDSEKIKQLETDIKNKIN